VAVRAGDVVVVDAERWPESLRGEIGLPVSVRTPTAGTLPPPAPPAAPAAAGMRPSAPISADEAIAQYRQDPDSVRFHPSSRAFRQTLLLEGFDGDEWPLAVRSGQLVIVDEQQWPAHLRAALGLRDDPK
jgi:hypothetical protein